MKKAVQNQIQYIWNIDIDKVKNHIKTGLYTYSIYSGMPIDFKDHELDVFLHDNRKVIEISAKISVQTATERVGTLVMGERREL